MMLFVFLYGVVFYVDAPIRPCGESFCGKTGLPHTHAEYESFLRWQETLLVTWIIGAPIHFGCWAAKRWGKWPSDS